ncbi:MAG: metal-sensitive transcriptional regulator [Parvularculaceae bacterium]
MAHLAAHRDRALIVARLNRVAGQVGGVARMVDEGRYCIDILTQIQAIKSALAKSEDLILQDHAAHCVADAMKSGDAAGKLKKFEELVDLFGKFKR